MGDDREHGAAPAFRGGGSPIANYATRLMFHQLRSAIIIAERRAVGNLAWKR